MMKKLLLTLLFFTAGFYLIAQNSADIEWSRTFGGIKGEVANSITATADGGYAIAGYTNSKGKGRSDLYIIKTDKDGRKVWEKVYGGKKYDVAKSIINTPDGGFIVTAETKSKTIGGLDVWVLKLDSKGDIKWEKTFGGRGTEFLGSFVSITKATDNGYVIVGHGRGKGIGSYDIFVMKISENGEKLWEKVYGKASEDFASAIITNPHGGYVIAGNTRSNVDGAFKFWFLMLDKKGSLVMERVLDEGEIANSIISTPDGGYAIAGNSQKGTGKSNMWLMKLDSDANIVWQKIINARFYDYANSIINTFDGGIVVAGFSLGEGDKNYNHRILKFNKIGDIEWEKTYGGMDDDRTNMIITTGMGEYVAAGLTKSEGAGHDDFSIFKFNGYLFDLNKCLEEARLDTVEYLLKPRGEFEKVSDYNNRVAVYEQLKFKAIEARIEKFKIEQHEKITKSYERVEGKIDKLSYYNADKEAYRVLVADCWYELPMKVNDAKDFKKTWSSMKVLGLRRLAPNLKKTELINLGFQDPGTGKLYAIGKQVKGKHDETLKAYVEAHANDSITPAPVKIKGNGTDIIGWPYTEPAEAKESKWFAELEDFKNRSYEECIKEKLLPHKGLLEPKDEFEKTKTYNQRVETYHMYKKSAVIECEEDKKFAEQEKIKSSYKFVDFKINEISQYNAEKEEFNVLINRKWYKAKVKKDNAVSFREEWKKMEVKGISRLNPENISKKEIINLKIFHTSVNEIYKVGKQINPKEDKFLNELIKNK